VADLFRLASGGTGLVAPGALHPDLVNRLASEAAKSARHVLGMCIRALDYCPPVDLSFGEYLRAVVTADVDLVPDDDLTYRIAFIEAFRRRGIYPRNVRSLSVDSLRWQQVTDKSASRPPMKARSPSSKRKASTATPSAAAVSSWRRRLPTMPGWSANWPA
jgi:hypothetical protein